MSFFFFFFWLFLFSLNRGRYTVGPGDGRVLGVTVYHTEAADGVLKGGGASLQRSGEELHYKKVAVLSGEAAFLNCTRKTCTLNNRTQFRYTDTTLQLADI